MALRHLAQLPPRRADGGVDIGQVLSRLRIERTGRYDVSLWQEAR